MVYLYIKYIMKHLLNNLTEQEKNSIREQHTGGMKVSNNRFKALLENKLGNSKPLVEKFDDEDDYDFEDEELYSGAPERLVKHMDSGKIVGTHKHGVGYTPNKHGIRLGHSSHPTSIPNFTKFDDEDDMYSINEGVNVVPKGKSELIQVLINKINNMGKINDVDAMDVAKTIYNNCVNFMNKADIFSDKTKYGEDVVQPPVSSRYEKVSEKLTTDDVNPMTNTNNAIETYGTSGTTETQY